MREKPRKQHVDHFYELMAKLRDGLGGFRYLSNLETKPNMGLPPYGIYFFFEGNENGQLGPDLRVSRIGVNGDKNTGGDSRALWGRLKDHRGPATDRSDYKGGGQHRGSIFREHVGYAIMMREEEDFAHLKEDWGDQDADVSGIREDEHPLELKISDYIRNLPFLWARIDGEPSKDCERALIETHITRLISNMNKENQIYGPREDWLGYHSPYCRVRESGLWSVEDIGVLYDYDPKYLKRLDHWIDETIEGRLGSFL